MGEPFPGSDARFATAHSSSWAIPRKLEMPRFVVRRRAISLRTISMLNR